MVLDQRVTKYRRIIFAIALIGFLAPIVVGGTAINLGTNPLDNQIVKAVFGLTLTLQAIASGWMVFTGIEKKLTGAQDSSSINKMYAVQCRDLAINTRLPDPYYQQQYDELKGKIRSQEGHDEKLEFTANDRRRAARAGMKRFVLPCSACQKIPKTADAKADNSTCPNCGEI